MHLSRRSFMASAAFAMSSTKYAIAAEAVDIRRLYVDGPYGQIHLRLARPTNQDLETQPPLVCFHYSPGSGRLYDPLLPYLARDRMVMAFDTPGYGNSTPPPEQPDIPGYARALAGAIEALVGGKMVDVFGEMTGSLIAVEIAVSRPDIVRRVVLSRAPVFSEESRVYGVAEMKRRHAERLVDAKATYLTERLDRGLGRLKDGDPPERYLGVFIDSMLPGHNWVYGEVAAFSYRADLNMPKITQPVLFITWIEDDAADAGGFGSVAEWTRGAEIIPNVTPLNLTGLGDWPWIERSDVISGHVLGFLDQP